MVISKRLLLLAVVTLLLGVTTLLANPKESAAFAGCSKECASSTTCKLAENTICFLGTWFPCENGPCKPPIQGD